MRFQRALLFLEYQFFEINYTLCLGTPESLNTRTDDREEWLNRSRLAGASDQPRRVPKSNFLIFPMLFSHPLDFK